MSQQEQIDKRLSEKDGVCYAPGVHLLLGGPLLTAVQNLVLPVTLIIEVMLLIYVLVIALDSQDALYLEADLLRYRVQTPRIDGTLMG